jgi:Transposase IS66 family
MLPFGAARHSKKLRTRQRPNRRQILARHPTTGPEITNCPVMLLASSSRTPSLLRGMGCILLDDGRLCMSNYAAERELRAVAVGRRSWTFAGSDEGGRAPLRSTPSPPSPSNDIDLRLGSRTCWSACTCRRSSGESRLCLASARLGCSFLPIRICCRRRPEIGRSRRAQIAAAPAGYRYRPRRPRGR